MDDYLRALSNYLWLQGILPGLRPFPAVTQSQHRYMGADGEEHVVETEGPFVLFVDQPSSVNPDSEDMLTNLRCLACGYRTEPDQAGKSVCCGANILSSRHP